MRITPWIALALALSLLAGQPAMADPPTLPRVDKRQQNQKDRVKQGVKSGELTKKEAGNIARERRDIKKLEREYGADGVVTNTERKDMERRMDEASRDIFQQKHDAQDRSPPPGNGTSDPLVNARQERQTDRMVQGVASGELTRQEATELTQERRDIRQLESSYKADGVLTEAERKDLHQQLDRAGEEIREEKHDGQQR
jgi:hypothetical protein